MQHAFFLLFRFLDKALFVRAVRDLSLSILLQQNITRLPPLRRRAALVPTSSNAAALSPPPKPWCFPNPDHVVFVPKPNRSLNQSCVASEKPFHFCKVDLSWFWKALADDAVLPTGASVQKTLRCVSLEGDYTTINTSLTQKKNTVSECNPIRLSPKCIWLNNLVIY